MFRVVFAFLPLNRTILTYLYFSIALCFHFFALHSSDDFLLVQHGSTCKHIQTHFLGYFFTELNFPRRLVRCHLIHLTLLFLMLIGGSVEVHETFDKHVENLQH